MREVPRNWRLSLLTQPPPVPHCALLAHVPIERSVVKSNQCNVRYSAGNAARRDTTNERTRKSRALRASQTQNCSQSEEGHRKAELIGAV